jgi:hypothetical protein
MEYAFFPILLIPTHQVRRALGSELSKVAVLAVKAILRNRKGFEVAHQQIRYRKLDLAFSSRIGSRGDIVLELDVGDPRLSHRLILEEDLRQLSRKPTTWNGRPRHGNFPA